MAISFTEAEKNYIATALNGKTPTQFWAKNTILKKLIQDQVDTENRQNCEHIYGTYKGKKECCTVCGHYDEQMGTEWELVD